LGSGAFHGDTINLAHQDAHDGPSRNVSAIVYSQIRSAIMPNRIRSGLKFLAGVVLLIGLVLVLNVLFSHRKTFPASPAKSTTLPTSVPTALSATPQPYNGLIAFVSKKSGNDEIYTMHLDGSHVTDLTNNPAGDYSPAWSPDGSRIAFVSERSGNAEIFVMNPDGSGLNQLTKTPGGDDGFFMWSPNGQKIAYISSTSQDFNMSQLYVMNVDGSGKVMLTNETGPYLLLGWSPDGQKIIYQKQDLNSDTINPGIYAVNDDGSARQELLETDSISITWEDTQHFYAVSGSTPWQVYRFNTDGTPPVLIASYPTPVFIWSGSGSNQNYVVKHFDMWDWYHIDGTTITHLSTWPSFSAICHRYTKDLYLNNANNWPSPNGDYGVVTVYCDEGNTWFYFVTADGSKIKLLLNDPLPLQDMGGASWSPDGRYIVIDMGNYQTGNSNLYLVDARKALQDPSIHAVQLTTDNVSTYDPTWQPQR
jgi:dipeptidyl aminopeptidase/acylaminoacyl peptidase